MGTVDQGGRAVVMPTSSSDRPVTAARTRIEASCEWRPCEGPIVTVVYRLESSIES